MKILIKGDLRKREKDEKKTLCNEELKYLFKVERTTYIYKTDIPRA